METAVKHINTGSGIAAKQWTIELSDLGAHQVFMGYSLSETYVMIGITSPNLESQISINTLPRNSEEEIVVPIELERCDPDLVGEIHFRNSGKLLENWEVFFYDNRFGDRSKVDGTVSIPIRGPEKNTRSEKLRLMGYAGNSSTSSVFELRLKPRV